MQSGPAHDGERPSADFTQTLAAARAGSVEALGQLFGDACERLHAVARAQLWRTNRDPAAADDCVQEACVRALPAFGGFQGVTAQEFAGWLRSILLNTLADTSRQRKPKPLVSARGAGKLDWKTPSWWMIICERNALFDKIVARLAPDYRDLLRMMWTAEGTWDDFGLELGRTADAARMLAGRALDAFRTEATDVEWEALLAVSGGYSAFGPKRRGGWGGDGNALDEASVCDPV